MDGLTEKLRGKPDVSPVRIPGGKNPFLFHVRSGEDPHEPVKMVIDAYLSSSEEAMFGNMLEETAISGLGGKAAGSQPQKGIDLEYDEAGTGTILQVKSGRTGKTPAGRLGWSGISTVPERSLVQAALPPDA